VLGADDHQSSAVNELLQHSNYGTWRSSQ